MYVYRKCAISIHYHYNNSVIAAGVLKLCSQLYHNYIIIIAWPRMRQRFSSTVRDVSTVWRCPIKSFDVSSQRNVVNIT